MGESFLIFFYLRFWSEFLEYFHCHQLFPSRIPEEFWQFFKNSWDLVVGISVIKTDGFTNFSNTECKKQNDLLKIHLENLEL